ncbi:hypothetical protein [Anaerosporobacter sp.]
MKKITLVLLSTLLLVGMTGCGKDKISISAEDVTTNTIVIKKDNTVQSSIIEDFNKDYYNKEELKTFINEEVAVYNKENGENQIKMHSLHVKDQKASVVFNYNDIEDYSSFNGTSAKLITTEQALKEESILSVLEFVDSKTKDTVSRETAFSKEDATVLIIQEPLDIRIDGTILYYSNVVKLEKNVLQTSGENIAVIVFAKKK